MELVQLVLGGDARLDRGKAVDARGSRVDTLVMRYTWRLTRDHKLHVKYTITRDDE